MMSTGSLALKTWAILWRSHVRRWVFRAVESIRSIWACLSFAVRVCLLMAANILSWWVWSWVQNIIGDLLNICLTGCRSWIKAERFLESPKLVSRRFLISAHCVGLRELTISATLSRNCGELRVRVGYLQQYFKNYYRLMKLLRNICLPGTIAKIYESL